MLRAAILALGLGIIATGPAAAAPSCSVPAGIWVNQMGSVMTISSYNTATGAISGTYKTSSGATGWYPLVGWVNGAASIPEKDNVVVMSFTVRWGSIGSITSWTGTCRVTSGTTVLTTLWDLAEPVSNYTWDHVLAGSDVFKPQ